MTRFADFSKGFLLQPLLDIGAALFAHLTGNRRPLRTLLGLLAAILVTWWIYVPIHELLHVAGCVWTGGSVTELQVDPKYGGALLARIFPFVVSGGDYAGRLSGFDTRGSDLVYLATVFMPFVLSVVLGVPLLQRAGRCRNVFLLGVAVVVGLAPFCSLIGDYYEMGSILATRAAGAAGLLQPAAVAAFRSDDVFKLVGDVVSDPQAFQLTTPGSTAIAVVVMLASATLAVLLALLTYHLGCCFASLLRRSAPAHPA